MFRWRRPYVDWRLFLFYPVIVLLPSSLAYSLITDPWTTHTVWDGLFLSLGFLAATLWMWGTAREGIYTNDQGVRVQHLIHRTELNWTDIVCAFDARPAGVIGFRTSDGGKVLSSVQWTGAIEYKSISPMMRRAAYDRLIARLNEQRVRATTPASTAEQLQ